MDYYDDDFEEEIEDESMGYHFSSKMPLLNIFFIEKN